ncbi:MAG: PTS lactose/cellobiose transporter subunit IIA [Firmicutes bacterium]|nr:PTS lactose/cellobiose transporter subunit IIA [Bacillota bacterium]
MNLQELEAVCMEMIANAGEGRSKVLEAADCFADGNPQRGAQLLEEAEKHIHDAHQIQFLKLLQPQAAGETIPFHLLLIHAMDLLMMAMSEKTLVEKMVRMNKSDTGGS